MMPDNGHCNPANAMPSHPSYHPKVDPLSQGVHSAAFTPQQTPYGPMAYPAGHSVKPVPPVSNLGEQQFDPDNPSKIPDDQVIVGRQPRTLSSLEWLGEQIKHGFASAVRTFKMMGIIFSIWRHGSSIESLQNAAERAQGGILVKAIQFVCSSPSIAEDVFRDDHEKFTKALSHVTTSNKPMTKAELIHCLDEAGIDYDPERLDERVNLGTGSIGEVNEIILNGGGRLIVKTVSPASETRVYSDLRVLRFMLGLVTFFSPSSIDKGTKHAIFSFFDSVKEELNLITEANRTRQQDYANKAIKQQHIYDIKQSDLPDCAYALPSRPNGWPIQHPDTGEVLLRLPVNFKVPAVYGDTASPHALGMEKIDGVTLSENDQPKLRGLAAKLFNTDPAKITDDHLVAFRFSLKNLAFHYWSYCYAQTGFFNADMHDGNVMVAVENGRLNIYFIDLGNAQKVSRNAVKATYTILGAMERLRQESGVATRSHYADEVIQCLQTLADYESDKAKWDKLKQEVLMLMPYREREEGDDIQKKVIELFNRAYNCHVKIPKETAALFRAKILIDSQNDMTDEARKSLDKIVPSLIELLGSDDSSGLPLGNVADQNALLMLLQQDPELRQELLGLLRTMPISEEQLHYATSQLLSKTDLSPDEFRREVYKLIQQWQMPPAYPGHPYSYSRPGSRVPPPVPF
ncbi:AarF/UbiB family protein [Endozoicomonas sp. YOMI1]|uniref:AarF/UbiB family protein n=1 Tax=Endozoicomonas sp. YOMI1 TaxID=2828739 RepID=UPI002148604E|nr:AarF/UbiB family protein [Endozoicomonas sp. YOMI1]